MMTCWQENEMKVKEHLYFMHDALKNVTSIFDGQQTKRTRYEYDPFGSLLVTEGDAAHENKFRFSCEFSDDDLGLVYYNYRHLNPQDGRWINRDPISEQGGWNLYGFVKNCSVSSTDKRGLKKAEPLQDYWDRWEKSKVGQLSKQQLNWARKMLANGCIDITIIALGRLPKYVNCFKTFTLAQKEYDKMKKDKSCGKNCPIIYSVHFGEKKPGDIAEFDKNDKLIKKNYI